MHRFLLPLLFLLPLFIPVAANAAAKSISVQGTWAFRLDPEKAGIDGRWFAQPLPDKIHLPGSTDQAGYGTPNNRPADFRYLSRLVEYTGPAWYQREVDIPADWAGQHITLFLERCHWETQVWVDDRHAGMQDSLCVPHVYDLSALLTPGKHRITVRVDNTIKFNVGPDAHSVTEQTQTNWNGIIGRLELRATDPVWIESLRVTPDVAKKVALVRVAVGRATGEPASGQVTLQVRGEGAGAAPVTVALPSVGGEVEATVPLGNGAHLWDEFHPALYDLHATLEAGRSRDEASVRFGLRSLGKLDNRKFTVNGRPILLRGTLDCCVYPLTGFPPMTVAEWRRVFQVCKSYGLNHVRYHSWCPPEEAFQAADEMGFLLQIEAPQWVFNVGQDAPRDAFIEAEVRRILDTYGNHPSFGFLCMGNELQGDSAFLAKLVRFGKEHDPRHLYLGSTWFTHTDEDQYRVDTVRGLHGPTTDKDFKEQAAKYPVPLVSHEIGQWAVYPRMKEIPKYKGVLRARNFEKVRDDLASKGMLDEAESFTQASGHLSAELYKEEIEVLLRTGNAGFQLLDLHDFPGQGTALVGMLDPFWDSKGFITPEAWRRFCGPTVPLLRISKRTYTTDETFSATAEVAHYGETDLPATAAEWRITDGAGKTVASGAFEARPVPTGGNTPLGAISASLAGVAAPAKLTVTASLAGASNSWDIWVYPAAKEVKIPSDVFVATAWDGNTRAALARGQKVLLLANRRILAQSVPGSFTPVFWSPIWFARENKSMTVLCDPAHPALAAFPTESYTDWQWYNLLQNSRSVVLDSFPAAYRPIVQVVDNFSRNHRLGNIFEARVGDGRLLITSIDLSTDVASRPAARQMLRSLLAYMESTAFQPSQALDAAALDPLFREPVSLDTLRRAPAPDVHPVLHLKAAGNVADLHTSAAWTEAADTVLAREPGFGYTVRAGTWKDEVGSAWHADSDLAVDIHCPKNFTGTLYAHFHDWNNLERTAEVSLEDRWLGDLESYAGPGVWLAIPVTAKDTADGIFTLHARPTAGPNAMITEIELVPGA